jgi:hypothetical protein
MSLGLGRDAAIASIAMLPRYHYVPTVFLTATVALAVATLDATPRTGRWATAATLLLAAWLAVRSRWDDPMIARLVTPDVLAVELRRLDADVRTAPADADVVFPNTPVGSGYLTLHEEAFPGRAAVCVIAHPDGVVGGRPVRFVERDRLLLERIRAQAGTPIARLVSGPDGDPGS